MAEDECEKVIEFKVMGNSWQKFRIGLHYPDKNISKNASVFIQINEREDPNNSLSPWKKTSNAVMFKARDLKKVIKALENLL